MSLLARQLRCLGFADLGITDPSESTKVVATRVGTAIGAAASTSVERLSVSKLGAKGPNTYGGNYGLNELPLHTDLAHWHRPPRYVLLRCIEGSSSVATKLLDRHDLQRHIPTSLMRRALFAPRRPLEGKLYLLRMLTEDAIRWDCLFLTPKNRSARDVAERMNELASCQSVQNIVLAEPGRTIILDNWRVLHGRSSVPGHGVGRLLDRAYFDLNEHGHKDTA